MWWGLKRILLSRFRDTEKRLKSKFRIKLHLRQVVRNQVSSQDRKKKIHQKFLSSKNDIKQPSDAT